MTRLPRWAELWLLPLFNLGIALAAAGTVVALVGQDPMHVLAVLLHGAFGSARGFSYTLYYATTFIFTGLAVAVAFHSGLFNIGGEGQAMFGGLGTGLVALWGMAWLPAWLLLPLMACGGALFGMAWAAVPGWLQAYRGSHVVITTIMFNFLASTLLVYLVVNHLKPAGLMAVESAPFGAAALLPGMHQALAWLGVEWPASPLNLSLLLALAAAAGVYLLLWRSRAGYRVRAVGSSPGAAAYAGIDPKRQVLLAMGISGALGIVLASVLFGALFQGGAELSFELPGFSRDMVVMLQGFIVLFSGAMAYVIAPWLARTLHALRPRLVVAHG
jgi:ABC-type uncharacterized transport system permease subunit